MLVGHGQTEVIIKDLGHSGPRVRDLRDPINGSTGLKLREVRSNPRSPTSSCLFSSSSCCFSLIILFFSLIGAAHVMNSLVSPWYFLHYWGCFLSLNLPSCGLSVPPNLACGLCSCTWQGGMTDEPWRVFMSGSSITPINLWKHSFSQYVWIRLSKVLYS